MKGHEVDGEGVDFSPGEDFWFIDERLYFSELGEEVPNFIAIGVEDVCPVGSDEEVFHHGVVCHPAQVGVFINDPAFFSVAGRLMGIRAAKETTSHDKYVVHSINPMQLDELKEKLDHDLTAQLVSGSTLLNSMRLLDENSRRTAAYADPNYAPFYLHLGKYFKARNVLEIGFTLGLLSSSYFTSCKNSKYFLGFLERKEEYSSLRLGRSNIKLKFRGDADFYCGKLHDDKFLEKFSPNSWDLTILNEELVYDKHLEYLDFAWPQVSDGGLVVAEYIERHIPAREAFLAFCESKNRTPVFFGTRYGTGILQK